jgi:hypothetical protein
MIDCNLNENSIINQYYIELRHCACAGNVAAEKLPDFAVDVANVFGRYQPVAADYDRDEWIVEVYSEHFVKSFVKFFIAICDVYLIVI